MNAGSCFLAEMRRMTSSLSPGATVSDSMSVTKPWRYSPRNSVSTSLFSVDMFSSLLVRRRAAVQHRTEVQARRQRHGPRQLRQGHGAERIADGQADALPVVAYAADRFDPAA